jgi:hypothetical protein
MGSEVLRRGASLPIFFGTTIVTKGQAPGTGAY